LFLLLAEDLLDGDGAALARRGQVGRQFAEFAQAGGRLRLLGRRPFLFERLRRLGAARQGRPVPVPQRGAGAPVAAVAALARRRGRRRRNGTRRPALRRPRRVEVPHAAAQVDHGPIGRRGRGDRRARGGRRGRRRRGGGRGRRRGRRHGGRRR